MAWGAYDAALAADPAGVAAVLAVAHVLGKHPIDARELAWTVERESGWNPGARNGASGAVGLIQFLPSTLSKLGAPPPPDFQLLGRIDQAYWVGRFFDLVGRVKIQRPGDVYLAVAAPGFLGRPDGTVVYARNTQAWRDNPAWRPPGGGDITAGSIRAFGRAPASGGPPPDPLSPLTPGKKLPPPSKGPPKTTPPGKTPPGKTPPPSPPATSGKGWILLALVVLLASGKRIV